jgi:hypothetical protein
MALRDGLISKPIAMADLVTREFIPKDIRPATINVSQAGAKGNHP